MPSQKQERASSENMEDKLRQYSDRPVHAERQQPTSRSDRVGDKTRHAHRQFSNNNKRDDKHRQKMTHSSSSVDDSKRKHSRQPHDDFDRDKSTRNHSGRLRDDSDGDRTKNKRRQSADNDGCNSGDGQNSRSKHQSKDLHRRHSSETEEEATESDRRARHRNSSGDGDERPDNSEGKIAGYGLIMSSRAAAAAAHRSKTQMTVKPTSVETNAQPAPKPPKRKLTEEEMAAKRAEMMENARSRDEQRTQNVKRYREDDERDRRRAEKSAAAASFVQPMMAQHASESSVEDRIKRNIYNIQRTSAQLDRNFARH